MELSDLHIFKTVATTESVSAAAKQLNYVQSNITARIKKLEATLNTPLFHRHNKGVTLTPEGKKLLEHAEEIFLIVDKIEKSLQDPNIPSGKLEIGTVETVIHLPEILAAYSKKYTDVDLSLVSGVTEQLIEKVLNNQLDGAFISGPVNHPQLNEYEVFEEDLVILTATEYDENDIATLPFLVFNKGCGYRAKLEEWLSDTDQQNAKMMELGTLETILGSVVAGLGATVVPRSTASNLLKKERVKAYFLPTEHSHISTVFILRSDAYITASIEKFIETIANHR